MIRLPSKKTHELNQCVFKSNAIDANHENNKNNSNDELAIDSQKFLITETNGSDLSTQAHPRSCDNNNCDEQIEEINYESEKLTEYNGFHFPTTSRCGREKQRYAGQKRLCVGSIPLLADGTVLLVSSSKHSEWILPKGGWEADESLEEGCLRETFEEAGVIGTLGPKVSSVEVRTKRNNIEKVREISVRRSFSDTDSTTNESPALEQSSNNDESPATITTTTSVAVENSSPKPASSPSNSVVEITYFILYIEHVSDSWPEQSSRSRTSMSLDEALESVRESRPEVYGVLKEVKELGLHEKFLGIKTSKK